MARDLAQRANDAVAQQNEQPTVAQMLHDLTPEIAKALPAHMTGERFSRIALTVFRQSKQLQQCDPMSFIGALMTCSQLGLEPGPLGEAYMVPFGNQVTFIPGYRGLLKLAYQSGKIQSIGAHVVREKDEFEFEYGLEEKLRHQPFMDGPRGEPVAVYAVAKYKDGGHHFIVMSMSAVEAVRKISRSANKGPWVDHWDAMARKTAIRQLIRWLPLSTELQVLARAAQLDESVRSDITTAVEQAPVGYIAGDLVQTEQGVTDSTTGEVVEPTVIEDPPDVPDGW